jgi:uncharacterized membrane protein YjfL (UPF0719 family)
VRFQRLDEEAATFSASQLQSRISARFPDRQLCFVAAEVHSAFGRVSAVKARQRQLQLVRQAATVVAVALVGVALGAVVAVLRDAASNGLPDRTSWLALIESGVNDFVFAGIAGVFLFSVPARIERRLIQQELHRLRSLAHVVDMHQLTKDPDQQLASALAPARTLDTVNLGRYLDYCSELLSLIAKNAALYAQMSNDPVVLQEVGDIETLTVGLSRKIWQKISLLHH